MADFPSDWSVQLTTVRPVGYAQAAGSVGRITLYVCETCGALVQTGYAAHHVQWHETLRRAVDEGGMLG